MIDRLLSVIAPHSCCGCGNVGTILCLNCKYDIIFDMDEQCLICQRPTSVNNLCFECKSNNSFDEAWYVAHRKGCLKTLLDMYKFKSAKEVADACVDLLDARLPLLSSELTLVPVPTAATHVRNRGFDHTQLIVKKLAKRKNIPYSQVLERTDNHTQHFKTKKERYINASKGLRVKGKVPKSILLIDDIYTTGSTLKACSSLLRSAGAKKIYIAVLARQEPHVE